MVKSILTVVAGAAVLACSSPTEPTPSSSNLSPSFASDHTVPGTPGEANCVGQSNAFVAQASKNGIVPEGFNGVGGILRFNGRTPQEQMDVVRTICNP
jgi:hypothetical protein